MTVDLSIHKKWDKSNSNKHSIVQMVSELLIYSVMKLKLDTQLMQLHSYRATDTQLMQLHSYRATDTQLMQSHSHKATDSSTE